MTQKSQWIHVNVHNAVISKLVETKTNSKYLIGYLDKVKDAEKGKNDKLMSFLVDDENQLEKYKTIWTRIEALKRLNWMICQSMMTDIWKIK